jgi:hypothetical protein
MQRGNADVLEPQAFEHLEPALAGAELLGLGIVRHDVAGINVRPRAELPHVVAEIDAGGFVVVDDPDLASDQLREPDRGRVAESEVPGRPHQRGRIVGHGRDAPILLGARISLPK